MYYEYFLWLVNKLMGEREALSNLQRKTLRNLEAVQLVAVFKSSEPGGTW